jgi:hypothetical protein
MSTIGYTNAMAIFESAPGGQTPAQIRELVTNNPRDSSLGYATLVFSAANPAHQGLIYRVHSVAKFGTRPHFWIHWDGHIFGSINDVVGHQIPTTVELPVDALFARQDDSVSFRVGLPQLMNAMFGTDPALELLGVFTNFDAGTELIQSRNMVPIPHRYMRHFIGGGVKPRHAWETAGSNIMNNNDQVACAPLLNFLRLACTRNVAGDAQGLVTKPVLEAPLADAALTRQRTELVEFKLPGLLRQDNKSLKVSES